MPAWLLVAIAILTTACSSPVAGQRGGPVVGGHSFLAECALPNVGGRVLCGSLDVPENRDQPTRRVPVNVAVLKATGPDVQPDPVVLLQGGPGQAGVPLAGLYGRLLADVRRQRDIVLVDARGTGTSNPLYCDLASPQWLKSTDVMPPEAIRACRDILQQRADLRRYTTEEIARDLDDVRRALGVEKWNVFGASYGTRLAQEYVRAFGAYVRTMTLNGVAAPSLAVPLPYARDAQAAADRLFRPDTQAQLTTVLANLRKEPAVVPTAGGEVMISAGNFAEALRHMLYNSASAGAAAAMIRDAALGDYTAAAEEVARQRRTYSRNIALGMFLSVTCAEDIPRIDEAAIAEATRGTFVGDFRVRQQMEACRNWAAGVAPARAATPLASHVPALLISGEVDPVTPPYMGEEVARTLPNAVHVVLAGHGHTLSIGRPCVKAALLRFIETGSARGLDLSCERVVSRP